MLVEGLTLSTFLKVLSFVKLKNTIFLLNKHKFSKENVSLIVFLLLKSLVSLPENRFWV